MSESVVTVSDHRIALAPHHLFARRWRPEAATGRGPVIVLFHDSIGSVALWRGFPEQLARATGLEVVAYDRLGFGQSDPNPARLGRDFMAEEARTALVALRSQLGIERFVAFGHSVGGAMAVAAGATFPADCVAIITEAAQTFPEARTLAGIRAARIQFADPAQLARLARYHGDKTEWALAAWIETWLAPEFADWTLDSLLVQIRCPLLAIHGGRDEYGSYVHPERIAATAGGPVTPLLIEDCGHVPHREDPGQVCATVAGFLADALSAHRDGA